MKSNGKTAKEVSKAVTVGNMKNAVTKGNKREDDAEGYAKTAATATTLLEFNETKSWVKDIEASFRDESGKVTKNAYLIIQLLEK